MRAAHTVRSRGARPLWNIVATYQVAQAQLAEQATKVMLDAQGIDSPPDATLKSSAFTTSQGTFGSMLEQAEADWQFNQLVNSLIQDAGRAAQSVSIATRPRIGHVRTLTSPSCSRCAVLAGRVYRYSTGFLRHPRCDCTMLPTTLANDHYVHDPADLLKSGLITGLSRADRQAVADGADLSQVVNVRLSGTNVAESGRALARRGRPTPEAIYRATSDRHAALALLQQHGYIR